MASLEQVFSRLLDDPAFADHLRSDPRSALGPYDLSVDDLRRLEALLADRIDLRNLLGAARDDPSA